MLKTENNQIVREYKTKDNSLNIMEAVSIGTKEMEVRLSIGGSVGINTGFEVQFDFSKGIVLDIALIFGGRIEVNWEKTDGQEK